MRYIYSNNNEISNKERKIIYKVLDQYDFQVINIIKIGNVYKVETSKGNICVKEMSYNKHKSNNISILFQELQVRDFNNIAKYYLTKDGKSYVRQKRALFYVIEWIDGKECDLGNLEEALSYMRLLAQFHKATSSMNINRFKVKNNLKNWPKVFNEGLYDIERYERLINNKKIKSEFDLSYYNRIEGMCRRGMIAHKFLNTDEYYNLFRKASKNRTLCYNNFHYKNIIKKEDECFIVDMNSVIIDLQVNELGKLINRLMFKNSFQWDFNKAKMLIEAYNSINKLDKSELQVLVAFIIFPYKFWKLGRKRYVKHKAWDESKYMRKLIKLTKYNEMQESFLEDYLKYLNEF